MPGYSQLNLSQTQAILQSHGETQLNGGGEKSGLNAYTYEVHAPAIAGAPRLIVIQTPIFAEQITDYLNDLKQFISAEPKDAFVLGVIGQGMIEDLHIVSIHIPPNGAPIAVYDSKYSNAKRFFSLENAAGNAVTGLLRTINPFARNTEVIKVPGLAADVNYNALGTQSYFDGVSCGYHTASNIRTLANLIIAGKQPTAQSLLTASNNPVTASAQALGTTIDNSFTGFLKKAWQDTFLPLASQYREQQHFGHYFMGWPQQETGSKMAYFLTFKFLTTALVNLLSLATELPLNVLSESASLLKNKIISWAPTYGITQGIRSAALVAFTGLQALFKCSALLLRTITSPIFSYKAAREKSPALGFLSALTSTLLLGSALLALVVFAPVIVAALAPSMSPEILSMIAALSAPVVELFSLLSVSLIPATATMLTAITAMLTVSLLHMLGRDVIYPAAIEPVVEGSDIISSEHDFEEIDDYGNIIAVPKLEVAAIAPSPRGASNMLNSNFGRSPQNSVANDFSEAPDPVIIGHTNQPTG